MASGGRPLALRACVKHETARSGFIVGASQIAQKPAGGGLSAPGPLRFPHVPWGPGYLGLLGYLETHVVGLWERKQT